MQALLAESRCGRVMLHLVCALRDHHLRWHRRGIMREFSPKLGWAAVPR